MARLPEGAEPVDNAVGTAPGVLVVDGPFAVLALPGVPAEMRAVLDAALPRLRDRLGAGAPLLEREVASGSGDESVITVAAERVMAAMPDVHCKSLARTFAPDCDLRVRLGVRCRDRAAGEARLARAAERLAAELARLR